MERYVLKFQKQGYMRYLSHLDTLRLFKRAFQRSSLSLAYSQGFNPHPKLSFAQPLSLGYGSCCELALFETVDSYEPADILARMQKILPAGMEALACCAYAPGLPSLAGDAESATYRVTIPLPAPSETSLASKDSVSSAPSTAFDASAPSTASTPSTLSGPDTPSTPSTASAPDTPSPASKGSVSSAPSTASTPSAPSTAPAETAASCTDVTAAYMAQPAITVTKPRKKGRTPAEVDIRPMIRCLTAHTESGRLVLVMELDCGSTSNLSPELVIESYCAFADLSVPRYEMDVERERMTFRSGFIL